MRRGRKNTNTMLATITHLLLSISYCVLGAFRVSSDAYSKPACSTTVQIWKFGLESEVADARPQAGNWQENKAKSGLSVS